MPFGFVIDPAPAEVTRLYESLSLLVLLRHTALPFMVCDRDSGQIRKLAQDTVKAKSLYL